MKNQKDHIDIYKHQIHILVISIMGHLRGCLIGAAGLVLWVSSLGLIPANRCYALAWDSAPRPVRKQQQHHRVTVATAGFPDGGGRLRLDVVVGRSSNTFSPHSRLQAQTMHRPIGRRTIIIHQAKSSDDENDDEDDSLASLRVIPAESVSLNQKQTIGWFFTLVLPLWLVYISNQWSRSSIYYLVNFDSSADAFTSMNVDLNFDQVQYGVLASVAFTSLFAVASLGAGYAADRFNRKALTIGAALTWTAAVAWTALGADSYAAVVAGRIVMGLACAFATPTAYTLIRDYVPPNRVATASSIYGTGVALGSGLASLTILLDNSVGWRGALNVIAIAGMISVVLAILLLPNDDETTRVGRDNDTILKTTTTTTTDDNAENGLALSIFNDVQEALATDRARWIYLASFLRFGAGLCIGVWSAPYFRMILDGSGSADYAVAQAAISALGASASGVLGGTIADQLSSSSWSSSSSLPDKDPIGRRLWVPAVGSVLAAPTWYYAMHSPDSFQWSMGWLAAEYFVAECWFGPTISTLQATVGSKVGGTAQGMFTLTGALANVAPTLVGYAYGQMVGDSSGGSSSSGELSGLLSLVVCGCYLSSAVCFYVASTASPTAPSSAAEQQVT